MAFFGVTGPGSLREATVSEGDSFARATVEDGGVRVVWERGRTAARRVQIERDTVRDRQEMALASVPFHEEQIRAIRRDLAEFPALIKAGRSDAGAYEIAKASSAGRIRHHEERIAQIRASVLEMSVPVGDVPEPEGGEVLVGARPVLAIV